MANFTILPEEMKIMILRAAITESDPGDYFEADSDFFHSLYETDARSSEAIRIVLRLCRVSKEFKILTTEALNQHLRTNYSVWLTLSELSEEVIKALYSAEADLVRGTFMGLTMMATKVNDLYSMPPLAWVDRDVYHWTVMQYWYATERNEAFEVFCHRSACTAFRDCEKFAGIFSELNVEQANLQKESLNFLTAFPELRQHNVHNVVFGKLSRFTKTDYQIAGREDPPRDSANAKLTISAVESLFETEDWFDSELAQRAIRANLIVKKGGGNDSDHILRAMKTVEGDAEDNDEEEDFLEDGMNEWYGDDGDGDESVSGGTDKEDEDTGCNEDE